MKIERDLKKCPVCGESMVTRTSRRVGTLVQRSRYCSAPDCDYADVAIVRPAEILTVRKHVVYTTPRPSEEA